MEMLWDLIEKSKNDKFDSKAQFKKIKELVLNYNLEELEEMNTDMTDILCEDLHHESDFDTLRKCNGGIIEGDDGLFYIDFTDWVIAQGKDFYEASMKDSQFISRYIIENNLTPN